MSPNRAVDDEEILSMISTLTEARRFPPTVREIMEALGLKSPSTVHVRLRQLRKHGYVDWMDGGSRTLVVTPEGAAHLESAE